MADILETDPIDLLLDSDGDLVVQGGDLVFSAGLSGVVQAIRIAILLVRGEWFLDLSAGVPYFERDGVPATDALMGQRFNKPKAQAIFRDAILSVPYVDSLTSLELEFTTATRVLTVTWQAMTSFGETPPDTLERGI